MEMIKVLSEEEGVWEYQDDFPGLRYKLLVDSTKIDNHGLSMGILELEPGAELPLHHHSPQEIYIIKKGIGLLLGRANHRQVSSEMTIYIPENEKHGLRNIGSETLSFYWIFPTDCWDQVEYLYN
ncbi:MAG: cupin domain-containing protein [Paracoccaceae bacterium]